jgi:hypothetical protein
MEDSCVTPGGLSWFLGGAKIRDPIRETEMGNEVRRVVGQPNSTRSMVKAM